MLRILPAFLLLLPSMAGDFGTAKRENATENARKHCGVSWVAGRRIDSDDLEALLDVGVDWIVQMPFGYQRDIDSPRIDLRTQGSYRRWGESDEGLQETARMARKLGIKSMLKPHIWLTRPQRGKWRADIAMKSEVDWEMWFASYSRFMLHYAKLASDSQMEVLCIGVELAKTVVARKDDWIALIAEVRKIYSGKLTYGANWYREYQLVPFWKQLDFIGIQAYFPLAKEESPELATLRKGWGGHLKSIESLQQRIGKPVIFTELGYRCMADAAIEPWRWIRSSRRRASVAGFETQADCYEAFFTEVWDKPWFAGVYFWKWFPKLRRSNRIAFSPQEKPAEKVIADWFLRERARAVTGKRR